MSARTAVRVMAAGVRGEDRAAVHEFPDSTIVVLADGAGGLSGGAEAADRIVAALAGPFPASPAVLRDALLDVDASLYLDSTAGSAACALLVVDATGVAGAVAGDVEVMRLGRDRVERLVGRREPKPLLGEGGCWPAVFAARRSATRLLACSDGLWKYVRPDAFLAAAREIDVEAAADALANAARLPGGALQDDLSLVLLDVG